MTRKMVTIDLNADIGEGFPNDDALLSLVTSVSVACGGHAGDRATMLWVLREARARSVAVGAHPGFYDRASFGRHERHVTSAEVEHLIVSQVQTLQTMASLSWDLEWVCYIKPHGALYNQAQRDPEVAKGVVKAAQTLGGLPLFGQAGTVLETLAMGAEIGFVAEGFPDRRYLPDGRLMPRTEPNAVLHDPAEIEAQVLWLVEQRVETLCIHGDDPRAVENAECVRATLLRHGITPKCGPPKWV